MPREGPNRLVFGFAPSVEGDRTRTALLDLCRVLGDAAGVEIAPMRVASYDALERALIEGHASFGWLPPVVLARLLLGGHVIPFAQCVRAGAASYHACLFTHEGSGIANLSDIRHARAAWVDRTSAAGYVFPRLMLAAEGIDLSHAFSHELFLQSHAEVVRSVIAGYADVGATFASMRADGTIVRGGWTDPDGSNARPIRVLATFGPIPNDAMAVRADISAPVREALTRAALSASGNPALRSALRQLFGADSLASVTEAAFGELRGLVGNAMRLGVPLHA